MTKREDFLKRVDETRRMFGIRETANLPFKKQNEKIVCPLPQHSHSAYTPSFSIYMGFDGVERFHCHGNCGLRGDVIDLMGHMNIPGYNNKRPADIIRSMNMINSSAEIRIPTPPKLPTILAPNAWVWYKNQLSEKAIRYAGKRGLSPDTLEHFKIGSYGNALAIPAFSGGVLQAIKFRNLNKWAKMRFWTEQGSVKTIFNHDDMYCTQLPVLLVTGEIPVMLCWQMGINIDNDLAVCSSTGGEKADLSPWHMDFSTSKRVVIVADNDPDPGVRAKIIKSTEKRADLLNADIKFPPKQYPDIDKWLLDQSVAIETIMRWLEE